MLLNKKEKDIISQILKGYGFELWGGSSELRENGKIIYHLAIEKGPAATFGPTLGPKLKMALGADEIYDMGLRLA